MDYGEYKVTGEQIDVLNNLLKKILKCLEAWTYVKDKEAELSDYEKERVDL